MEEKIFLQDGGVLVNASQVKISRQVELICAAIADAVTILCAHVKSLWAAVIAVTLAQYAFANPAHDQISAMSEDQRRSIMALFLVKSGEKCSAVSRTFYQGSDKRGNAFWNAACVSGDSFVVQINNDASGSTRILSCKLLKRVNSGTCFTKFKQ